MRYQIDIENDYTLTLGDRDGVLEIALDGGLDDCYDLVKFSLNEKQLNELVQAIELIKSLRPKPTGQISPGQFGHYPPGVRGGIIADGAGGWGYTNTSHADNPNG